FWLAGALYRLLHGRTGLGGGDIKLAAALGAWLGWPQVPSLLLLTATLSLASWGLMAACGRTSRMQPLGPSLALGGLLVLLMSAGRIKVCPGTAVLAGSRTTDPAGFGLL